MTAAGRSDRAVERDRVVGLRIVAVAAAIELVSYVWLVLTGRVSFMAFLWTPDTPSYLHIADAMAQKFTLIGGDRTLGYPVVLAAGELIGGIGNGPYVVIALQLVLNLGFTWGCWRLLERLAPDAILAIRVVATLVFFWAGLGMALYLMTDFLAALFFAGFVYGFLYWRSTSGLALSGVSLALATVTRPSFTLLPILLPGLAYLVGRITSKVPLTHVFVLAAISTGATGSSVAYQYWLNNGYVGPSPILILPIREMIYYGIEDGEDSPVLYEAFKQRFEQRIERMAERPYSSLSSREREDYAKVIFKEEAVAHPLAVVQNVATNFAKYMLVPVESVPMRVTYWIAGPQAYREYLRPLMTLLFLPLWVLALVPPLGESPSRRMYYVLMWACVFCTVGLASITTGSGERIRFIVLATMLPVMVWNAQALYEYAAGRVGRRTRHEAGLAS